MSYVYSSFLYTLHAIKVESPANGHTLCRNISQQRTALPLAVMWRETQVERMALCYELSPTGRECDSDKHILNMR